MLTFNVFIIFVSLSNDPLYVIVIPHPAYACQVQKHCMEKLNVLTQDLVVLSVPIHIVTCTCG